VLSKPFTDVASISPIEMSPPDHATTLKDLQTSTPNAATSLCGTAKPAALRYRGIRSFRLQARAARWLALCLRCLRGPEALRAQLARYVADASAHLPAGATALAAYCAAMAVAFLHGGDHFDPTAYRNERAWQSAYIVDALQL
jgi:hypothetical protein